VQITRETDSTNTRGTHEEQTCHTRQSHVPLTTITSQRRFNNQSTTSQQQVNNESTTSRHRLQQVGAGRASSGPVAKLPGRRGNQATGHYQSASRWLALATRRGARRVASALARPPRIAPPKRRRSRRRAGASRRHARRRSVGGRLRGRGVPFAPGPPPRRPGPLGPRRPVRCSGAEASPSPRRRRFRGGPAPGGPRIRARAESRAPSMARGTRFRHPCAALVALGLVGRKAPSRVVCGSPRNRSDFAPGSHPCSKSSPSMARRRDPEGTIGRASRDRVFLYASPGGSPGAGRGGPRPWRRALDLSDQFPFQALRFPDHARPPSLRFPRSFPRPPAPSPPPHRFAPPLLLARSIPARPLFPPAYSFSFLSHPREAITPPFLRGQHRHAFQAPLRHEHRTRPKAPGPTCASPISGRPVPIAISLRPSLRPEKNGQAK